MGGVALRCSAAAKAQSDERYWVQLGAPNLLRATDNSPAFTLSEAFLNQPEYYVCAPGSVITSLNVHTTAGQEPSGDVPVRSWARQREDWTGKELSQDSSFCAG